MPDFSFLLMPFLAFVIGLSGLAIADWQSVYVDTIGVPRSLLDRGYTSNVIVDRLFARMNTVTSEGRSELPGRRLESAYGDNGPAQALSAEFGVIGLVRSVQRSTGLIEVFLEGNLTQTNDRLTFAMSGASKNGRVFNLRQTADVNRVEPLISQIADEVMAQIDPYTYGLYLFRTNIETWNFHELDELIERETQRANPLRLAFFHNLAALRDVATGFDQAAIDHFQQAIATGLAPGLFEFNLGLLHEVRGRYDEALGHFQRAIEHAAQNDFVALSYAEWGSILQKRGGRPSEVDAKFAAALRLGPKEYHIHREWANVLRQRGLLTEADAELAKAVQLARDRPPYTENLLSLFLLWGADDEI